jgi:hypothetical protein
LIETVEAVMPVRLSGARERLTGRRLRLFLGSFAHFWADAKPLRLTIVGLKDELAELQKLTRGRPSLDIRILDERALIDRPEIMRTTPWIRQLFIKLLFAGLCDADAYLYLDADIICVGRLHRRDFVRDGKAVSDWEPKSIHPQWWRESRRLLGRTDPAHEVGLTVTPNVLTREIARAVPDAVANALGRDPIEALAQSFKEDGTGWTETTIYTEFGEMTGDLGRLHAGVETTGCFHSPTDVWNPERFAGWQPVRELLANRKPRFLTVQSTTLVSPSRLRWKLAPILYAPIWR